MSTWGIIPVKQFANAKSRLGSILPENERKLFAMALFEHVYSIMKNHGQIDNVLVATDCDEIKATVDANGDFSIKDSSTLFGDNIAQALEFTRQESASSVLVIMADLPRLTIDSIDLMLNRLNEYHVVIAPDADLMGTNAIALSPPDRMLTAFGHQNSFERHLQQASESSLVMDIVDHRSLAFDVDTPEHYRQLGY